MSRALYDQIGIELQKEYDVVMGQMFGKPCLKLNGKAFAAFFQDAMVFKLGKEEVDTLKSKYPESVNWDPSGKGRPMKDWLQVPQEFSEDWRFLVSNALVRMR